MNDGFKADTADSTGPEAIDNVNLLKYNSKLVGVTFEGRQDVISKLTGSEPLRVRREADNKYDNKAVAVDVLKGSEWLPVGYIAKDKNKDIAATLDAGEEVYIKISSITGGGERSFGINIYLEYTKPVEQKKPEQPKVTREDISRVLNYLLGAVGEKPTKEKKTTTFNSEILGRSVEVVENGGHVSIPGFVSGSSFPEQFYPEFKKDEIIDAIVNKYDVDKNKISDMWDLNKTIATSFGTSVHAAMQNYDTHNVLGDKIKSVKTFKTKPDEVGPNKALSRNPIFRSVVENFHKEFGDKCPVMSEVFVFDEGFKMCGTIDRLKFIDKKKKIVRIQDYKTDGDIHEKKYQVKESPFKAKLGNELLDFHWLQLSFYAFILERAGFKVEGLDIFWLNPEKLIKGVNPWEHFEHERVDISEFIVG